jgi:diguanylate cyclase (GGDEF)-like protein
MAMTRLLGVRTWWWVVGAVALGAVAALDDGHGAGTVWRPLLVLAGITAAFVVRRSDPPQTLLALALAAVSFRIAVNPLDVLSLPAPSGVTAWAQAIADVVAGVLLIGAVLLALRSRRGTRGRRELLDGLTVLAGAGLTAWLTLANPALDEGMRPGLAVVATAYIPLTIMLVTFTVELMFEGVARNRGMWLMLTAGLTALGGAIARALVQAELLPEPWQGLPVGMVVAAAGMLLAATMRTDTQQIFDSSTREVTIAPTARHETLLMAPLIVSLAVPVVLVATVPRTSTVDLVVRLGATMVLVGAIVGRLYVALDTSSKAQRALVRRLDRDELTDLPTRSRLLQHVAQVLDDTWRSEHHATLIQLNIDRFKNINDTLGHDAANSLLVQLAQRLTAAADEFGGIVARAGGDDFVILDGSTRTYDDARQRVDLLSSMLGTPFTIDGDTVFVTASIGVAVAPRNRTITAEELMRRADIATHRAKADGRNRTVVFDDSMQSTLTHRMDVEHALHGAVARQELRLYYQPIVDLDRGLLTGFEALIRWQRDGNVLQPGDFIPIAEETGIIHEIGAWALREALLDLRRWMDDGIIATSLTMSVNVSPRQIADPAFASVVRDALDQSGISPHLLWVEMTESMMLDEPELAENTLRLIRSMGVRLALDDFGTGYSSLSLLQQFPIQRIKIDRAFVQGIADRSNDRSLVRTIIAMAQSMGLDLVAEGVETVHQLQSLRDLGCDKAQGYLISRPVPANAMRSTMVALDEFKDLALFTAAELGRRVAFTPERWLEPVGAGAPSPLSRQLATRPLG